MRVSIWISGLYLVVSASLAEENHIDMEYVKAVDSNLFQLLVRIEQCKDEGKSAQECKLIIMPEQSEQTTQQTLTSTEVSSVHNDSESSTTSNTAVASAKMPSNWWMTSVYQNGDTPSPTLRHAIQSSISIGEAYGNIESSRYAASLNYFLRKEAWTNEFLISYSKDTTEQAGLPTIDRDYYLVNNNLQFDLDHLWFTEAGIIYEKDTILALENKHTYYLGLGAHAINSKTLTLQFLSALGRQKETFSAANELATGLNRFEYNLLYAVEQARWSIADNLIFNQSLQVSYGLEKLADFSSIGSPSCMKTLTLDATFCVSDLERRVLTTLKLGLEYQINEYLSLSYDMSYMFNSQAFLDDESKQSNHSFGIIAKYQ